MTTLTLILRGLRFHARSHLGALLGAAAGSTVLVGALVVGDSIRGSLRDMAQARLGGIQLALHGDDRFFRARLADDLAARTDATFETVVPAVLLPASVATPDESALANRVQAVGVDSRFWKLSDAQPSFDSPSADAVVLNQPLATQLNVKAGDSVVMRIAKPGLLSREAAITPQDDASISIRLNVAAIASDAEFGRFGLRASQIAPYNAFLSIATLQERLDQPGKANLLAASTGAGPQSAANADSALRDAWTLEDANLELRALPDVNALELRSSRVFLDPPIVDAALDAGTNAGGILTYFVNELRAGSRATPYSMVTAMGGPVVPPEMGDDEILINQWLADDLQARPGDRLSLAYFVIGGAQRLEERTNAFTVRAVIPIAGVAADRGLMPEFPGIERAESTRDWDSSLPIQLDRIRPGDEDYWEGYRGTPKAFITLAAGLNLWGNRFGSLTAVRYPLGDSNADQIERSILRSLPPAAIGLSFVPVAEEALSAANQSQDFGGLFIGFSFFLITAALLLMALLFQFGIEQRATEVGTLLALGFTPGNVRRLLLLEGGALAVIGGVIGAAGGVGYARAMLHGLSTVWRDAVGTSALRFHAEPATLAMGAVSGILVALFTMWLALRKQARQPARELLAEGAGSASELAGQKPGTTSRWIGISGGTLGLAAIGWALWSGENANAETFFGAGSLLLIAGLGFAAAYLASLAVEHRGDITGLTLGQLGVRNCARRRKRSLSTLGLLACGSFLIASIGVFRLDSVKDAGKRSSGTGGFALIGESTVPVVQDLNDRAGREFFGLDDRAMDGVQVVPMRVRDGDDASCLNLNRAQKPRLLGVKPESLADRHAFTFVKMVVGAVKDNPWLSLNRDSFNPGEGMALYPEEVPAIGDEASIVWAMGRKVGDTIEYTDERGRAFRIRLVASVANSILQGNLLIADDEFVQRYPSESGHRMLLIDAPADRVEAVSATLARALRNFGLELTPATRRLEAFNAVQNTYLSTFQVLGGLGLLLGSVGLGVVVMRNVFERRGELALLLAIGFTPRSLKKLVLAEHGALLLGGLGVGMVAAFAAVLPSLLSPGASVPYPSLGLTLGAVLLNGLVWTFLATALALRGKLLDALRNE